MTDEKEARALVAESGHMLLEEGLAARTWGNISCRIGDSSIAITPSGLGYEGMKPEDIVTIDIASGVWKGTRKPSSEKAVHIAAYKAFSDAEFVIHTHQAYASAIGLAGFCSLSLTEEEKTLLGGLAIAGYGLSSTKKLAKNVAKAFNTGAHVVFMAHHGVAIAGKNRDEAFARASLLEKVCLRSCKGQPKTPPPSDEILAWRLVTAAQKEYPCCAYTSSAPVLACAAEGESIPAQLDDMAQMIGPRLLTAQPDEASVIAALRENDAVLVPGVGAVCRADSQDDCHAVCLLTEKACICRLHTKALNVDGRLSSFDTWIMRTVYLKKYSKKKGG